MGVMSEKCLHVVRVVAVGLMAIVLAGGPLAPRAEAAGCQLCSKWKNLRAKCWAKKLSGGGMVICEFRFSQIEPGFAAETPKDRETVTYTCGELKALPRRARAREDPDPEAGVPAGGGERAQVHVTQHAEDGPGVNRAPARL